MKYITSGLEETSKLASDFVSNKIEKSEGRATIIGLYGDLGAGKTSFTQGLSKALGIQDIILSPTFVIEKIYPIPSENKWKYLIHIDAYRLEKSEEMLKLGWREIISNQENLIVIEWPEKISDIMPEHFRINFNHAGGDKREIEIL